MSRALLVAAAALDQCYRGAPIMRHRTRSPFHNSTSFRQGPDPRRHRFTLDECRRGGIASWHRTMAQVRLDMGLSLPLEAVRDAARRLIEFRRQSANASA